MKWYDRISFIYDYVTQSFYSNARSKLIDSLSINEGDNILVIACGTGQSFKFIQDKLKGTGQIIAIDLSNGMLKQAQKKITKSKWNNIKLIQADARDLTREFFARKNIDCNYDIVIGELAFSVVPEWERVMRESIELLVTGGRFGLLDWYRKKNDLTTRLVNFVANAETTRDTISYASQLTAKFSIKHTFFFNSIYIGVGEK